MNGTSMRLAILTIGLFIASLHDLYYLRVGWPVVAVVGAGIALLSSVQYEAHERARRLLQLGVFGALLTCASAVWASETFRERLALKAPIGILYGLLIVFLFGSRKNAATDARKAVTYLLAAHVTFWCVQGALAYTTGDYLDFTGMFSDNPARYVAYIHTGAFAGTFTRGTGLFAEPSAYSAFVFMAVGARLAGCGFKLHPLDWLAGATMIGSMALSGLVLATLLLIVSSLASGRWKLASVVSCTAGALYWFGTGGADYVLERTREIDKDGSADARFISMWDYVSGQDTAGLLLGSGLGGYSWKIGRGSGVGDLLVYMGAIGALLFLGLFGAAFVTRRAGWYTFALWLATLGLAPVTTEPFWWAWSGLMIASVSGDEPL